MLWGLCVSCGFAVVHVVCEVYMRMHVMCVYKCVWIA